MVNARMSDNERNAISRRTEATVHRLADSPSKTFVGLGLVDGGPFDPISKERIGHVILARALFDPKAGLHQSMVDLKVDAAPLHRKGRGVRSAR